MKTLLLLLAIAANGDPSLDSILAGLGSPDYQTRRKAVLACEGRPEPEILDRLLEMARGDDHPNIRGYVADVLPAFDDPRVFPALREMATSESRWPGPRQAALVALGETGDPRARDLLLAALGSDPQTAAHAAKGLGYLADEGTFDAVLACFDTYSESGWVGPMASEALGRIDPERAVAAMLERFGKLAPGAVGHAADVLAEHAEPKAALELIRYLRGQDDARRRAAIRALGGMPTLN